MFFVVEDSHSKWLEVAIVSASSTQKTIDILRSVFARYGLPEQLVLDNGLQFTSKELEQFTEQMESDTSGVHHTTLPPMARLSDLFEQ